MALKPVGAQLILEDRGFFSGMKKANNSLSDFGKSAKGTSVGTIALGTALGNLAAGGLLAVTRGLIDATKAGAGFLAGSVGMAADLEAQMSGVGAVLGATNEELDQLNALVVDLGIDPNLKVSSLEAAQAIEVLAKNGLDMSQIMDGAARSTVFLANSTGANFATAADVATDAMSQFNISAGDMGRAVDGITGVVTNSKFDIDDYRLAIANAGAIASASGVTFEDFNTALAATASSFASGSDAGTSLKTTLQRLSNPTGKAAKLMDELGISLFDSEGNTRSLSEVIDQLNAAFATMTTEQQAATAAQLGGADASRTLLALAQMTGAEFETLSEKVNAQGQAADAAAMRVNNFAGAMDILDGIVESVRLQIGDAFLPVLTQLAKTVGQFVEANSGPLIAFFEQTATGVQAFVNAVTAGQAPLQAFFSSLQSVGLNTEPLQAFVNEISRLAATVGNFVSTHAEAFKGALIGIGAVLAGAAIAAGISAIAAAVAALVSPIGLVVAAAAGLGAAWTANWGDIQGKTQAAIEFLTPIFNQIVAVIQDSIPPALAMARQAFEALTVAMQPLTEIVQGIILVFQDFQAGVLGVDYPWEDVFPEWLAGTMYQVTEVMQGLTLVFQDFQTGALGIDYPWEDVFPEWLSATIYTVIGAVKTATDHFQALSDWFMGNLPTMQATFLTTWEVIKASVTVVVNTITATLMPALQESFNNLSAAARVLGLDWSDVWTAIKDAVQIVAVSIGAIILGLVSVFNGMVTGIAAGVTSITGALARLSANFTSAMDNITNLVINAGKMWQAIFQGDFPAALEFAGNAIEAWKGLIGNVLEGISATFDLTFGTIIATIGGFVEGVLSFFKNLARELVGASIIPDMAQQIIAVFNDMSGEVLQVISAMGQKMVSTVKGFAGKMVSAGKDLMAGLVQGIKSGASSVIDAITGTLQRALDAAKAKLGISSPSKVFIKIGEQIAQGLAAGITAGSKNVVDAIGKLLSAAGNLTNIGQGVSGRLLDPIQKRVDDWQASLDMSRDALAEMFGRDALSDFDINELFVQSQLRPDLFSQEQLRLIERANFQQNQLGAATAELRAEQEKLLQIEKQRADLAFLQQQLDLIKLVRDQGLDASILQGLQFGMEADLSALLSAVSAATQAMINQAATDLGIASPSKVFAEFGANLMQGMAQGVASNALMPARAVAGATTQMIRPPASAQTIINRSQQNNFNMSVSNAMDTNMLISLIKQTVVGAI